LKEGIRGLLVTDRKGSCAAKQGKRIQNNPKTLKKHQKGAKTPFPRLKTAEERRTTQGEKAHKREKNLKAS